VCISAPLVKWKSSSTCRAHVKAIGMSRDDMTVTGVELVHTCGENALKRKRNYCTKDIADVSEVVDLYQPTTSKAGNTLNS
jgi:hypothetical protein